MFANDSRENLFAEIYYQNLQWAEVSYEAKLGKFVVTIFAPRDEGDRYVLPLEEARDALDRAAQGLLASGYGSEDKLERKTQG